MQLTFSDGEIVEHEIGGVTFICRPPLGDIEEKLTALIDEGLQDAQDKKNNSLSSGVKKTNQYIDLFVVGWKGDNVKPLPTGANPSAHLVLSVKKELRDWYNQQFILSVDETKN